MNFLKKLGTYIVKGLQIAEPFLPMLSGVIPQRAATVVKEVSDDLTKVAGIIQAVEVMGQAVTSPLPGAEKLLAATPLVAQIVLQSDMLVGHEIHDSALFTAGCKKLADGMADVLNSLKG
jgi:hypothetical protein